MIDIHAHILPSLDDGPKTIEESIEICKVAVNDGIKIIVATPHTKDGVYNAKSDEILNAVDELNLKLEDNGVDLKVLPGAEIHIFEGVVECIKSGEVLTVNNGGKFILLELPFFFVPLGADKLVFNLKANGIVPIIAHAERILPFQKNPELVRQLVKSGALVQVNSFGLRRRAIARERKCAKWLLQNRLVHFIASDTHSIKGRPPILSTAFEYAANIVGEIEAWALVYNNPDQIINGLDIN